VCLCQNTIILKKPLLIASSCIVLCIASFGGGYAYSSRTTSKQKAPSAAIQEEKYPLLAKRIFVDNPNDVIINFADLREKLRDYMKINNLGGSIYFEYLPTGTSVRVEGDDEYVAASLMKIPVVMEMYKEAELGRLDIDKKMPLRAEWLDKDFGDLYKKGVGYELTLREAAKEALSKSDNTAVAMILSNTRGILSLNENVISSLDVTFNRDDKSQIAISARSYASFLKCLYFSCYNNYQNSQDILESLTKSEFNNRLRQGVPVEVKVAHKIGTYSNITQSDCGVVYEPKRNYLLCAMLQTTDTDTGNKHVADISKITYDFVVSNGNSADRRPE
jgi:beta-lactamase class A